MRMQDIQPTQALQMSLRFEKLMVEERFKVSLEEKTDVELLGMLIDRYNTYKSNLAIRKWQISDDMRRSIEGNVIGKTPTTKRLIRSHLDFNKWEESAYNESILKSRRHRLHEGAKGVSGQWVMILTVPWPEIGGSYFMFQFHVLFRNCQRLVPLLTPFDI